MFARVDFGAGFILLGSTWCHAFDRVVDVYSGHWARFVALGLDDARHMLTA